MIKPLLNIEDLAPFSAKVRDEVCELAYFIFSDNAELCRRRSKQCVLKLRQALQPEYHPVLPRSGCGNDWLDTQLLNHVAPKFWASVKSLALLHFRSRSEEDDARIIEEFHLLVEDLRAQYVGALALAA